MRTEIPILKRKFIVVALLVLCGSVHAQTQGPLPKCFAAELMVKGSLEEYDAWHKGMSFDVQMRTVQVKVDKLTATYGPKMGATYKEVQSNFVKGLYEGDDDSRMSPEEMRASLARSFYHDPSCPQST